MTAVPGPDKVVAARPAPARRPPVAAPLEGNRDAVRAVLGRVQRSALVGPADDAFEREAVSVAQRVAAGPDAPVAVGAAPSVDVARIVRRQEAPAAAEAAPPAVEPEPWPEADESERELLARTQAAPLVGAAGGVVADPGLVGRLAAPGPGMPVPDGVLRRVARVLPYDFSEVRVHDGALAHRDAATLSARAFTLGRDVWLGRGERADDAPLMAHELTHVVQQGAAAPVAARPRGPPSPAARTVQRAFLPAGIAADIAAYAERIPGWRLLTVVLGRDPVTDREVQRTPAAVARGVLDLVPGGDRIHQNLVESGALDRAVTHLREQIAALGITWDAVIGLLQRAWDVVSMSDVLDPAAAWQRLRPIVAEPAVRLVRFAQNVASWLLELILDAVLTAAGPIGARVMSVLRRAGQVIGKVAADPVGFLRNLMSAALTGFRQFAGNILEHLRTSFVEWLFGALGQGGLRLPERLDLRGLLSIALQILDLTYGSIRRRLARIVGEGRIAAIERAFGFLGTLATEGLAGAWRQVMAWAGNFRETVIEGIQTYIRDTIVGQGIQWLIGLLTPAGAIIQAIRGIYNVIRWLIDQGERLAALAETVFDSLGSIAAGRVEAAANLVERTLGRLVPVAIDLLARLAGLGDLAGRIRSIIARVRERIDQALTRLVNWIVSRARSVLSRLLGGPGGDASPAERVDSALAEARTAVDRFAGRPVGALVLRPLLGAIRMRYQLTSLEPVEVEGRWWVEGAASPGKKAPTAALVPGGAAASVASDPQQSAPGLRRIGRHGSKPPSLRNGPVIHWLESEHVIPFATGKRLWDMVGLIVPGRGGHEDRRQTTIMIYHGAARLKTPADNEMSGAFEAALERADVAPRLARARRAYDAGERTAQSRMQDLVALVMQGLRVARDDAVERTVHAIAQENAERKDGSLRTNGERRGPPGSPEPPLPTASEVAAAADIQYDNVVDLVEQDVAALNIRL